MQTEIFVPNMWLRVYIITTYYYVANKGLDFIHIKVNAYNNYVVNKISYLVSISTHKGSVKLTP